jgi:hypothetical protein
MFACRLEFRSLLFAGIDSSWPLHCLLGCLLISLMDAEFLYRLVVVSAHWFSEETVLSNLIDACGSAHLNLLSFLPCLQESLCCVLCIVLLSLGLGPNFCNAVGELIVCLARMCSLACLAIRGALSRE